MSTTKPIEGPKVDPALTAYRLFKAAPDLLQALQAVVEDFGSHNLSVRTIDSVLAAIDKAKGINA